MRRSGAESWSQSKQKAGEKSYGPSESERAGVDARLVQPGHFSGTVSDDPGDGPVRQQNTNQPAGKPEHNIFREKLAHDAVWRSSERCAHGNLFLARAGSSKLQIRNVRARNQQEEADGGEHHAQT